MTTLDLTTFYAQAPAGQTLFTESVTFIQTDSVRSGECRWYLSHCNDDDPAYFLEMDLTPVGVLKALAQLAQKPWTDKGQLLEAMLPVILHVGLTSE